MLPYRPVAAVYFRGTQGHKNCAYNCLSVELLNQILGCADIPGGALGFNPVCYGHPDTGRPRYVPTADEDGMMITGTWLVPHFPYPPSEPVSPQNMGLTNLFTLSMMSPLMASADQEKVWEKVKLPYRPEIMINYGANSIMSVGNAETVAETLKRIPFIASFDIFLNEFTDFADVVFPDTCYLERNDVTPHHPFIFNHPAGSGEWCWGIRQTIVEPKEQRRSFAEVVLELVDKLDLWHVYNVAYNHTLGLQEPHKLVPGKKYSYDEICDITLKSFFGAEKGLEWFRGHGIIKWPKKVEEVYWRHYLNVRVPVYFEFLKVLGGKIKNISDNLGLSVDFRHYEALPEWLPCPAHGVKETEFDFYGFYYHDVLHTNSYTMENPWLDEASLMNPYTYTIAINTKTAQKKCISDGDPVWVENIKGRRVKGMARLTEGIHPEGLAIAACAGHWSKDQPIARGKGVFFNDLLEVDLEHSDPVTFTLDTCVKVKVTKARRE